MITKDFLEKYPLLKKYPVTFEKVHVSQYGERGTLRKLPKPPIKMYCKLCNDIQTFNMENDFYHFSMEPHNRTISPLGTVLELRYLCESCHQYRHTFFVAFGTDKKPKEDANTFSGWIRKIGQAPPWEIEMQKPLEKALGDNADLYKKGLVCESQGYGIGAYAYFRRITEKVIDELLNSIITLIDEDEKPQYEEALAKVKATRITEDKIKLVQDLLPQSLQPDGYNPLKALYSALSDGLHNKSDDDCMELADTIKAVLIYLLEEIQSRNEKSKVFSEKMKALLAKK